MKKWYGLTALVALVVLTGCPPEDEGGGWKQHADYRAGVPSSAALKLDVPNQQGSGGLTLGETAPFYQLTWGVSVHVNAHVLAMMALLETISLLPPTEVGDDYRVWGPSEPQGLEAVAWRMRVDKRAEGHFGFVLEGAPKANPSAFQAVVSGEHFPGAQRPRGRGSMTLHFDHYRAVSQDPCRDGRVQVAWEATAELRSVEVSWEAYVDTCRDVTLTDTTYAYEQAADHSGTFLFMAHDNIHEDAARPGLETVTMRSRWNGDGLGRADVRLEGEEIAADLQAAGLEATSVVASQCWDTLFRLTFADTAPEALRPLVVPLLGEEAACAPFSAAEYPAL